MKDDWYDPKLMGQFLDLLMEDAEKNPSILIPYTKEMRDKAKALIDGVEVEMEIYITENGQVFIPCHDVLANEDGFDCDPAPITDASGRPGHGVEGRVIYTWVDGSERQFRLLHPSDIITSNTTAHIFGFSHGTDSIVRWEVEEID